MLSFWKAAYDNLAENMRERGLWTITVQNVEMLAGEMEKKIQELNDSKP